MLAPVAFAAPKETQVAIPVLGVFTALPINVPVDAALMVAATLAAFFWLYSIFI